jgi:lysozyme
MSRMKPIIYAVFATVLLTACAERPVKPAGPSQPAPVAPPPSTVTATGPTESTLALLRKHEGYRETVYADGEGKAIAGLGHKLTPSELSRYPKGSKVPQATLDKWQRQDTEEAWRIAAQQAREVGEPRLTEGLFAVVFQLGPYWYTVHNKTWMYLNDQQWQKAAAEAQDSAWYRQTPQRVQDFQRALDSL